MKKIKSLAEYKCKNKKCGHEFTRRVVYSQRCNKCGGYDFSIKFLTDDCSLCKNFKTDEKIYPSGKCKIYSGIISIGNYCLEFKKL